MDPDMAISKLQKYVFGITRLMSFYIVATDITPLDCFPWGYIKSKVYADKPAMIQVFGYNNTPVINTIPVEVLERAIQNLTLRMDTVRRSCGQHLKEIIFKKERA